ncbi:MAG: hypothetical protein HWQ23_03315 [Nostoc sp. JL33]|uniref:hypothetical protein n=1 Tax=Nostoc sp. JL33 TaxID=2815396 RepID=UPI0025DCEF2F|nr:hypothetical protein [Nostoc sp. JL33]MBN3869370.1 hypothetical protein [Nostoc sp. JL33]
MQPNTEINLSKSKITGVSKLNNEFLTFCSQSREEWRRWLEKTIAPLLVCGSFTTK